jgi:hypothetical protein
MAPTRQSRLQYSDWVAGGDLAMYLYLMNSGRNEEIAAAVGAHQTLGPAYDDAIAAGLVERIGVEVDRRVDERMSQQAQPGPHAQRLPAVHSGGQISWQQVILALGSMVIGAITSASVNNDHGVGPWPVIVIWVSIAFINIAIFHAGHDHRSSK